MSRQTQKFLLILVSVAFLSLYVGFDYGRRGYTVALRRKPPQLEIVQKNPPSNFQKLDFSLFWQVLDLLNQKSVYRPIEPKKALYGAIKGLTDSVGDPYTAFLTPDQNRLVKSSLEGKYEGIGAELGMRCPAGPAETVGEVNPTGNCRQQELIIVSPLDDSPAKAAGIRAGDAILKIDGRETLAISLTEAVTKIRGAAGTKVQLSLVRSGRDQPFEVTITRGKITVPSVKFEDKGNGVAYVRLSRFGETTNEEWDQVVSSLKSRMAKVRAIIVDVRYNPGGYLESAIHVASDFIGSGKVVSEQFADGSEQPFSVDHAGALLETPVVVLINRGSASAAEILAGALRDARGAKLVGEKSFGKGSVQDASDLTDGSGVHITIAKWLTPKGTAINGRGLEADVKIEVKDEEVTPEHDPQLEKAIEMAKKL